MQNMNQANYASGISAVDISEPVETTAQKTYTVKYIGVVEGSMGILSRKMRMPKFTEASVYEQKEYMNQLDETNNEFYQREKEKEKYLALQPYPNDGISNKTNFRKSKASKVLIGGFAKRNIVIDKPLLATKRNVCFVNQGNFRLINISH